MLDGRTGYVLWPLLVNLHHDGRWQSMRAAIYCRVSTRDKAMPIQDRFWPKVSIGTDLECWNWNGAKDANGYGKIGSGARGMGTVGAHRLAYMLVKGDIPPAFDLDHLCRNPSCVNPYHLEAVPRRENLIRGVGLPGFNNRKTHCPRGHEYAGANLIRAFYGGKHMRYCRTCVNQRQRDMRARKSNAKSSNLRQS